MSRHYDTASDGEWTFHPDVTHGPIIFRKGCEGDPFVSDSGALSGDGIAVATSEWGIVDEEILAKILDAANNVERMRGL